MADTDKPYVVRSTWEGTELTVTEHDFEFEADTEYDARVSWYLNLPDLTLAVGTCIQVIEVETDRVLTEHVVA